MFIKQIKLENFQRHTIFEADLTEGVNVLYGETDAGKSCVVRAIRWVLFNEPKGDVVRKIGSDVTSVSLTLDNGITVQRIKSSSQNAYVVKSGDEGERRYDAIGKEVPDEIVKLLGVFPMKVDKDSLILNIAPQIALPFLLNESGTMRMKVFNVLTGNDILDKVSQSINKDTLALKKERKEKEDAIAEKSVQLDDLKHELNVKRDRHTQASRKYALLEGRIEDYARVAQYAERFSALHEALMDNAKRIKAIKFPPENVIPRLKERAEDFNRAESHYSRKVGLEAQARAVDERLKRFKIPKSVDSLKGDAERLEFVTQLFTTRRLKSSTYRTLSEELVATEERVVKATAEYKEILKEYGRCPTCHQEITESTLKELRF